MYVGAVFPDMGFVALVKAFTAAVLGGMGSVPGAVLGGFALAVAESLGSSYLPSGFSDAVPYLLLFVVLLFLPGGLTLPTTTRRSRRTWRRSTRPPPCWSSSSWAGSGARRARCSARWW